MAKNEEVVLKGFLRDITGSPVDLTVILLEEIDDMYGNYWGEIETVLLEDIDVTDFFDTNDIKRKAVEQLKQDKYNSLMEFKDEQ